MENDSLSFPGPDAHGPWRRNRRGVHGECTQSGAVSLWGQPLGFLTVPFFSRDVRSLGITMMGHQKKILSSIQAMRSQLLNTNGPRRHL